jgi:uncharacterized protein YcaQ
MPRHHRANRDRILAFRLSGHHLIERQPLADLVTEAGAGGMRNTPPGSSLLALHARLTDLTPAALDTALTEERTLVEVLGMRISPHLIPTSDLPVFTLGALPREEASLREVLKSFLPQLDEAGVTASDALEQAAEAARAELADGPLGRGALSAGMTRRLPPALSAFCRPCGATHVFESLFRLVGVRGVWVLRRTGKLTIYERTDRWLGSTPEGDPALLRAALLQQYLRCFGPSTPKAFAEWVGIGAAEAQADWEQIGETLAETEVDGHRAWLHADDLTTLEHPPEPAGVRFLPPYDAYLDQRDRATLIPDTARHRQVWAALGNPGALLVDGEIVGTWRPQKQGKRLTVAISAFGPIPRPTRAEVEAEAALLGPIRACTSVAVTIDA